MIKCVVLLDDIRYMGKVSAIISKSAKQIEVIHYIDVQQLDQLLYEEELPMLVTNIDILEAAQDYQCDLDRVSNVILLVNEEDKVPSSELTITTVNEKYLITELLTAVNDVFVSHFGKEEYIPITFNYLKVGTSLPCDIYLKLGSDKYLKVQHKDSKIDDEFIKKYRNRNISHIYVTTEDYPDFHKFNFQKTQIFKDKKEEIAISVNAIEALHNYVNDLGFDPKVINMTSKIHGNLKEQFKDNKFMTELLKRLSLMEGSFLYNHSFLTSVIALTAANKYSWMNLENKEKLYLGSMIHDLGYRNKENAYKEMLTHADIKTLGDEVKEDILGHTERFTEKLAQCNDVHDDVLKMVRFHHAVHGAEGYPSKPIYPNEISLVFALFILSHELALQLFRINFNENKMLNAIDDVCEKFSGGSYRRVTKEFRQAMIEQFDL
jgi:hypothetical protein